MRAMWLVILLAAFSATVFAQSDDEGLIDTDEDSLFGSEDDLFSQPLVEEVTESATDISATLLTSEAVRIGGRYSFSVEASSRWDDITTVPDIFFSPDSMSLTTSLSSQLFFDARPDRDFRVFGKMTASYPFETDVDRDLQDVFHVEELFSDFNWNDTVFFRGGKQAMNWGVGYFFSPADLLSISEINPEDPEAEREGPVGLKLNAPIGVNNLYLYALPAFADDFTDIGVAAKVEIVLGGTELGYGEVLQADIASARMITLSTSVGDFDLFAEGVMTYGSNRTYVQVDGAAPFGVSTYRRDGEIIFNASAGFLWRQSIGDGDSSLMLIGQYFYNGEGYSDPSVTRDNQAGVGALLFAGDLAVADLLYTGQHYSGVQASWSDVFGLGINAGVFWMQNYVDMSARVVPSLSGTILDTVSLSLQVPMTFGDSTDEFSPGGSSLAISVSASLGGGSFLAMEARVLIVEDEREVAELVQMYLQNEGVETVIAESAEEGLRLLAEDAADLVVLDINLPGMDGFDFVQKLRSTSSVPVMIVSAREADEDIVMGLGMGADEFVTKPFAPRVLVARIRALLRRARDSGGRVIKFGPFRLDVEGYTLTKAGERVVISSKEFEVLRHLVTHPGQAMTPHQIYSEVWQNEFGDVTAVAVYVRRIRQKIENDPQRPTYLQTIHGSGYRFNPDTVGAGERP